MAKRSFPFKDLWTLGQSFYPVNYNVWYLRPSFNFYPDNTKISILYLLREKGSGALGENGDGPSSLNRHKCDGLLVFCAL